MDLVLACAPLVIQTLKCGACEMNMTDSGQKFVNMVRGGTDSVRLANATLRAAKVCPCCGNDLIHLHPSDVSRIWSKWFAINPDTPGKPRTVQEFIDTYGVQKCPPAAAQGAFF